MNPVVFGKAHRALCQVLSTPLSAINILSITKSKITNNELLIHYEHNDRNQCYEYAYLSVSTVEAASPLLRKSNTKGYYFLGKDCDLSNESKLKYAELPDVKILIDDKDNPYSECIKKLIAVSFLPFFDVAKLLYPSLFQALHSRYNSFYNELAAPDSLSPIRNKQQDIYIKLLTIFDIPVAQEVLYYQRMLELNGLVTKYVDNTGAIYYLNGYKNTWLPFNYVDKKLLAIKFAREMLTEQVRI